MINLIHLHLKNIIYFKDAKLKFNTEGVTFVRGCNLDADPANPTGNGAGKSLLFSCLPNIFYFSPPSATRKNSKKELLGKGSSNKVTFENKGVTYEVEQTPKGYVIKEDGVDQKFGRIPDSEKYIQKIFPLLEIDYYTYCYVSTQRPYLMQTDTDTNRLEYITSMFRLDSYDLMKSHFLKKLSEVKSNEIRLSVSLKNHKESEDLLESLGDSGYIPDKELPKELSKELDALNKRKYTLESDIQVLNSVIRIDEKLEKLGRKNTFKGTPAKVASMLKAERKLVVAEDNFQESLKAYKKNSTKIQEALDSIEDPKYSKAELQDLLEVVERNITKEEDLLPSIKERCSTKERLESKITKIEKSLTLPEQDVDLDTDYEEGIAECNATLKLKKLVDHGKANCPVCLSSVDLPSITKIVAKAEKRKERLEELLEGQEKVVELYKYREELEGLVTAEEELDSCSKKIAKLRNLRKEYKLCGDTYAQIRQLKSNQKMLTKPVRSTGKPTMELTQEKLEYHIDLCSEIESLQDSRAELISNTSLPKVLDSTSDKLSKEIASLEKVILKTRKKLEVLSEEIEQHTIKDVERGLAKKSLEKLSKEIEELHPTVENKKVLETLVKAYSSKGLKTIVANEICLLLTTNLNAYCHLVFSENFVFSIDVSESGVSIKVDRGHGFISDVRNLSGAESNSFRLLFLLSMLVLIPDSRRLNMLVLDEPCSHQDSVSRELFLTQYLPALQELIPNIYIITPNKSDYIPGSGLIMVTKEKGKSSLRRGNIV